ncbi:MAG TPA: DUF1638 domain-containing protein [Anaerolineales bacterium]|nr:DUF1638 domain-containing protein [Anaerolineales bacterium]
MAEKEKQPVVVLSCKVFKDLFDRLASDGLIDRFIYLDYGLHDAPRKLNESVQGALDALEEPSLVVLGYGLCGNGLNGIRSGRHTLLIPRADDCIAIFLGSYARYQKEFKAESATYYLTKGWLESGSDPLREYRKYVDRYGAQKADWLIDSLYHNYKRLVFVAHSQEDLDAYRERALEVARFCERWGMRYEEMRGSTDFFEQLLDLATDPAQGSTDFIVIPSDGELKQMQFLRL